VVWNDDESSATSGQDTVALVRVFRAQILAHFWIGRTREFLYAPQAWSLASALVLIDYGEVAGEVLHVYAVSTMRRRKTMPSQWIDTVGWCWASAWASAGLWCWAAPWLLGQVSPGRFSLLFYFMFYIFYFQFHLLNSNLNSILLCRCFFIFQLGLNNKNHCIVLLF
jgi:hypothetical protein